MTVIVDIQTVLLQHLGRHLGSIVRTTRVMTMEFEHPPTGTEATGRKHWCKSGTSLWLQCMEAMPLISFECWWAVEVSNLRPQQCECH